MSLLLCVPPLRLRRRKGKLLKAAIIDYETWAEAEDFEKKDAPPN